MPGENVTKFFIENIKQNLKKKYKKKIINKMKLKMLPRI